MDKSRRYRPLFFGYINILVSLIYLTSLILNQKVEFLAIIINYISICVFIILPYFIAEKKFISYYNRSQKHAYIIQVILTIIFVLLCIGNFKSNYDDASIALIMLLIVLCNVAITILTIFTLKLVSVFSAISKNRGK